MQFKYQLTSLMLVLVAGAVLSILVGCAPASTSTSVRNAPTTSPTPPPLTPADLVKLRWIEGSWRGTGDVEKPFYERYRFENDTTLAVDGFDDEKLSKVTDTTRFELKDGRFGNGGDGARWVATALDDFLSLSPKLAIHSVGKRNPPTFGRLSWTGRRPTRLQRVSASTRWSAGHHRRKIERRAR